MSQGDSEEDCGGASPSLNFDVLRRILYFLPVVDLKQAVTVSHSIYEEAIREILTRGIRFDGSPTKLQAFCQFMLERDPPLFPFLHSFEIIRIASDDFDPSALLRMLSLATYLTELRFHWPAKDTLNLFAPAGGTCLAAIFPKLQSLRRLQLGNVPPRACTDLAAALPNLAPSLRTLQVTSNHLDPIQFPRTLGALLTRLCSLRIYYPALTHPRWEPSLSPSTRSISASGARAPTPTRTPSPPAKRALAFQAAGGGWKRLAVLSTTTAAEAWMLGVACRVRAVRLGAYNATRHAAFVDVIARVRPTRVTMALGCTACFVHPLGARSIFHFPATGRPLPDARASLSVGDANLHTSAGGGAFSPVTHAVLLAVVPSTRTQADAEETQGAPRIAETIGSHLRHSRLSYLHVVIPPDERLKAMVFMQDERHIYQYALRRVSVVDPDPASPQEARAPSRFAAIDIPLLVSSLATAGCHLRTIALTIAERGQSVWRIDRGINGHARVISKIMDPVLAKTIIAEEEEA